MKFETKIFEALGEASKGIFDSTVATTIGDKLVNDIKSDIFEMLTWVSKNNYEPIHDGRWCKKYISTTISPEELFNKWLKEKYEN